MTSTYRKALAELHRTVRTIELCERAEADARADGDLVAAQLWRGAAADVQRRDYPNAMTAANGLGVLAA